MTTITGRKTAKLTEAIATARRIGVQPTDTRGELYHALELAGYNWDASAQTWSKLNPWTGSAFEGPDGQPTGRIKIRIMTHPNETQGTISVVTEALFNAGLRVTEVSGQYPNRRGPAERTYITAEVKR